MSKSYPIREKQKSNLHRFYNSYLCQWDLNIQHINNLKRRGLQHEHWQKAGYASKQVSNSNNAQMVLGNMVKLHGDDLKNVPGFFINEKSKNLDQLWHAGMLIPVRNHSGSIACLSIKNDKPKKGNKYVYFSSGSKGGAKVDVKTHCPIITGAAKEVCGTEMRITEGFLKADIATALGNGMYCVGLPGLNVTNDLFEIVEELEISTIIIALDAGEDTNEDMIEAIAKLFKFAEDAGIDCKLERWDSKHGKGIDDVLAAGHDDKIKYATKDEINEILATADIERPSILVFGGGLSSNASAGERALIEAGLPIYQRSKKLVSPVIEKREASKGRQTKVAILNEISTTRMIDHLCSVANWEKIGRNGNYFIDPPFSVADTILKRYGAWKFPRLAGVIMTPTLRPDGSLLKETGYDEATRLYLVDPPDMPDIPEKPTKDDAIKALELLKDLLVDFPFVDDASRSVALSAFITPIVRAACQVVPLHAISAPTPGTGKSFLLDTAAAIAVGQPCPIIAAGRNEEETEKRLGAALLTGQPILSIDNLNGDLSGDALCQAIERPFFTMRILGKSENVTIESRSTLFANGNNIRLTGDITRRAIQCNMDANIERPEQRNFKMNPFLTVMDNRGKYIAAILTIARAYIEAGKPNIIKPRLASFEDWSDLVRSCLVWLGEADPLDSMEKTRAQDPKLQAMAEVFTAIWEQMEGQGFTSREIIDIAVEKEGGDEDAAFENPALKAALQNVAADNRGSYIDARRLGRWFSSHKGRIWNGFRLENSVDDHGHAATWWLAKLDDSGLAVKSGQNQHKTDSGDDMPM